MTVSLNSTSHIIRSLLLGNGTNLQELALDWLLTSENVEDYCLGICVSNSLL
jgi:hypothetical protein